MARPFRVLLLTTSLGRGGAEQQVADLGLSLRARGSEVAVLSMTPNLSHMDELRAADIEVGTLDMQPGKPTVAGLLGYRSFIRRWRPELVHSHMVHANLLARLGRPFALSTPVICTVHTVMEGRRWRSVAYRLTDRLAAATTAVSQAAAERSIRVGAVPRSRMTVIPNGFDFARARVEPGASESIRRQLQVGGDFLWVTVGRLVPEKGHDALLRAFVALRRDWPAARLVIVGDGPIKKALDQLIGELGLVGSATLLGERQDVPAILAAADGFVLSSRWEGLPMVLLEAAGQMLPIVSTDVGGCREVVRPELGGILTGTSPDSIAIGMSRVMGLTDAERGRIGRELRAHVAADFDLETIVMRWERLYASVIDR